MENNQFIGTENPSDVQFTGEPPKPGTDASVNYPPADSTNPDSNAATMADYPSAQNPVNGNSGEIAGYQSAQVSENGATQSETDNMIVDQQYLDGVYSVEEERLWNMVRANCLDFNSWTALIEETERVAATDVTKIRKVYDAFLAEFPLCFGYWKKYADHEARLDGIEKTVEVYERAVLAVTYSVEIWVNYCQFAIATYDDPEIIRRLFDRGLAYVGTDYRSDLLWDEYIRYEESQQAWSNLAMIYTRILEHPVQQFDRYFNCFKELTASHPLSELRTSEEAATLATSTDLETRRDEQVLNGEVPPDSENEEPTKQGTDSEELEKYIAIREEMYKKAKEYESKVISFELAIRRPYFHVKPLDDPELDNWHNYLDFIEREDDFNKVVKLYERCLIACANYPEYWIRYVLHMDATGSLELANNALARAIQVFVKKQPEIHLFAARFKEQTGDLEGARAEFQLLYSDISPGLLEAIVKHANMEYRLGEKEMAFSVYERAIAAEQEKEQSAILPMLLVQYCRFLYLVVGDGEKAKGTLGGSLEKLQLSKHILEAIIHLESIGPSPKRINFLDSLVEKFITPSQENSTDSSEREELSCIFLEFLDMFGDGDSIRKASNRHMRLFSRQRSVLLSRKRKVDDSLLADRSKISKTDQGQVQAQSLLGTYPTSQAGVTAQWPTAYAQKSPAPVAASAPAPALTPTAAPVIAPAPAWTPTYTAQAGYTAYGGYAAYAQVQAPQSTPQAATAYAAYPTAYAPQAYQPQSVAQPGAAATAATASIPAQPAAATQPYYGTTYY